MSVLLMGEWLGSTEDYDRGSASIQKNHGWQGGPQVHIMAPISEDRFTVVTVWNDKAHADKWFEEVMQYIQGAGVRPAGEMKFYDVHRFLANGEDQLQSQSGRMQDA